MRHLVSPTALVTLVTSLALAGCANDGQLDSSGLDAAHSATDGRVASIDGADLSVGVVKLPTLDPVARPGFDYPEDRLIVGFDDVNLIAPERLQGSQHSFQLIRELRLDGFALYKVPAGMTVEMAIDELDKQPDVWVAEPDYYRHASFTPNDTYYSYQWHFDEINMEAAWDLSTGSGAIVAVIDTGLRTGLSDSPVNVVTGYDFANGDSNPFDDNGHGTHVSGTIAQATDNGNGVAGVAFDASIMPIKVLNSAGSGSTSDIIDGIDFAVANGADVINMSLGSAYGSTAEQTALQDAEAAGVIIACATGNDGSSSSISYPARYDECIAVGGTGYLGSRTPYSNEGAELDVVAPGGNTGVDDNGDGYADGVLQQLTSGGYSFWQGTSMATPHVAGVSALLISAGADPADVRGYLQDTAQDLGSTGWDSIYGHGLIDAAAALDAVGGTASPDDDLDGWTVADGDCDDTNGSINPGATEIAYDGIDQDCSGADLTDVDGDGYDSDTVGGLDCNDSDAGINPGAAEIAYDGIDQDCSGADLTDVDGDGYDYTTDCDDNNAAVNPGATEVAYDGLDNDCSGGDLTDVDGDGYDSDAVGGDDCDDSNGAINPAASEIAYDGIDQDCSGADLTDVDGDGYDYTSDCDDNNAAVNPGATEVPYDGIDQDCSGADLTDVDGDGYDGDVDDCDDNNAAVNPGATEVCDGVDNDCDTLVDTDDGSLDASTAGTWFLDADGDFWGDSGVSTVSCDQPTSYVDIDGDCDDTNSAVNPDATEVPYDGLDNDCVGGDLTDVDGDGYDGDVDDCDDNNSAVNPGATEVPYDGLDNDCVGGDVTDVDGDGYDSDAVGGDDCNDDDAGINPGATEIADDGIDQDCDGADLTTGDTTPPVISSVTSDKYRRYVSVSFATDETATGQVCDARGNCWSTGTGTSHITGYKKMKGGTYTVYATDADGNSSSYGPTSY